MKTEYKKVSELLALENEEVLKEFEMVELKGGAGGNTIVNDSACTSNNNCPCPPPNSMCYCTINLDCNSCGTLPPSIKV